MSDLEFLGGGSVTGLALLPSPEEIERRSAVDLVAPEKVQRELWWNLNLVVLMYAVAGIYRAYLLAGVRTKSQLAGLTSDEKDALTTATVLANWAHRHFDDRDRFSAEIDALGGKVSKELDYRKELTWIEDNFSRFVDEAEYWTDAPYDKAVGDNRAIRRLRRKCREVVSYARNSLAARVNCNALVATLRNRSAGH